MLIDASADVNIQDIYGETALMIAIRQLRLDYKYRYGNRLTIIVKKLIDAGTDLNLRNNDALTAELIAATYGCNNIIKMLINAELNIQNNIVKIKDD